MKSIFFILLALGMTEPINANLVKIKTVHPVPVNPEPAKLNPVKLDPFLKPPSSLKNLPPRPEEFKEFEKLLSQGDMKSFYNTAEKLYRKIGCINETSVSKEMISYQLWLFYYLGAAPIGYQDLSHPSKENISPFIGSKNDILLKHWVFDSMLFLDHSKIASKLDIREREINLLTASYASAYIKQFRSVANNGFSDTFPTEDEIFGKEYIRGQFEARRRYSDMYVTAQNRQLSAKSNLERMEKLWMTILIKHFSNSKADILKFIRMAGYRDGEMVDLFDRTVGRGPKTDFIYKGFRKNDLR